MDPFDAFDAVSNRGAAPPDTTSPRRPPRPAAGGAVTLTTASTPNLPASASTVAVASTSVAELDNIMQQFDAKAAKDLRTAMTQATQFLVALVDAGTPPVYELGQHVCSNVAILVMEHYVKKMVAALTTKTALQTARSDITLPFRSIVQNVHHGVEQNDPTPPFSWKQCKPLHLVLNYAASIIQSDTLSARLGLDFAAVISYLLQFSVYRDAVVPTWIYALFTKIISLLSIATTVPVPKDGSATGVASHDTDEFAAYANLAAVLVSLPHWAAAWERREAELHTMIQKVASIAHSGLSVECTLRVQSGMLSALSVIVAGCAAEGDARSGASSSPSERSASFFPRFPQRPIASAVATSHAICRLLRYSHAFWPQASRKDAWRLQLSQLTIVVCRAFQEEYEWLRVHQTSLMMPSWLAVVYASPKISGAATGGPATTTGEILDIPRLLAEATSRYTMKPGQKSTTVSATMTLPSLASASTDVCVWKHFLRTLHEFILPAVFASVDSSRMDFTCVAGKDILLFPCTELDSFFQSVSGVLSAALRTEALYQDMLDALEESDVRLGGDDGGRRPTKKSRPDPSTDVSGSGSAGFRSKVLAQVLRVFHDVQNSLRGATSLLHATGSGGPSSASTSAGHASASSALSTYRIAMWLHTIAVRPAQMFSLGTSITVANDLTRSWVWELAASDRQQVAEAVSWLPLSNTDGPASSSSMGGLVPGSSSDAPPWQPLHAALVVLCGDLSRGSYQRVFQTLAVGAVARSTSLNSIAASTQSSEPRAGSSSQGPPVTTTTSAASPPSVPPPSPIKYALLSAAVRCGEPNLDALLGVLDAMSESPHLAAAFRWCSSSSSASNRITTFASNDEVPPAPAQWLKDLAAPPSVSVMRTLVALLAAVRSSSVKRTECVAGQLHSPTGGQKITDAVVSYVGACAVPPFSGDALSMALRALHLLFTPVSAPDDRLLIMDDVGRQEKGKRPPAHRWLEHDLEVLSKEQRPSDSFSRQPLVPAMLKHVVGSLLPKVLRHWGAASGGANLEQWARAAVSGAASNITAADIPGVVQWALLLARLYVDSPNPSPPGNNNTGHGHAAATSTADALWQALGVTAQEPSTPQQAAALLVLLMQLIDKASQKLTPLQPETFAVVHVWADAATTYLPSLFEACRRITAEATADPGQRLLSALGSLGRKLMSLSEALTTWRPSRLSSTEVLTNVRCARSSLYLVLERFYVLQERFGLAQATRSDALLQPVTTIAAYRAALGSCVLVGDGATKPQSVAPHALSSIGPLLRFLAAVPGAEPLHRELLNVLEARYEFGLPSTIIRGIRPSTILRGIDYPPDVVPAFGSTTTRSLDVASAAATAVSCLDRTVAVMKRHPVVSADTHAVGAHPLRSVMSVAAGYDVLHHNMRRLLSLVATNATAVEDASSRSQNTSIASIGALQMKAALMESLWNCALEGLQSPSSRIVRSAIPLVALLIGRHAEWVQEPSAALSFLFESMLQPVMEWAEATLVGLSEGSGAQSVTSGHRTAGADSLAHYDRFLNVAWLLSCLSRCTGSRVSALLLSRVVELGALRTFHHQSLLKVVVSVGAAAHGFLHRPEAWLASVAEEVFVSWCAVHGHPLEAFPSVLFDDSEPAAEGGPTSDSFILPSHAGGAQTIRWLLHSVFPIVSVKPEKLSGRATDDDDGATDGLVSRRIAAAVLAASVSSSHRSELMAAIEAAAADGASKAGGAPIRLLTATLEHVLPTLLCLNVDVVGGPSGSMVASSLHSDVLERSTLALDWVRLQLSDTKFTSLSRQQTDFLMWQCSRLLIVTPKDLRGAAGEVWTRIGTTLTSMVSATSAVALPVKRVITGMSAAMNKVANVLDEIVGRSHLGGGGPYMVVHEAVDARPLGRLDCRSFRRAIAKILSLSGQPAALGNVSGWMCANRGDNCVAWLSHLSLELSAYATPSMAPGRSSTLPAAGLCAESATEVVRLLCANAFILSNFVVTDRAVLQLPIAVKFALRLSVRCIVTVSELASALQQGRSAAVSAASFNGQDAWEAGTVETLMGSFCCMFTALWMQGAAVVGDRWMRLQFEWATGHLLRALSCLPRSMTVAAEFLTSALTVAVEAGRNDPRCERRVLRVERSVQRYLAATTKPSSVAAATTAAGALPQYVEETAWMTRHPSVLTKGDDWMMSQTQNMGGGLEVLVAEVATDLGPTKGTAAATSAPAPRGGKIVIDLVDDDDDDGDASTKQQGSNAKEDVPAYDSEIIAIAAVHPCVAILVDLCGGVRKTTGGQKGAAAGADTAAGTKANTGRKIVDEQDLMLLGWPSSSDVDASVSYSELGRYVLEHRADVQLAMQGESLVAALVITLVSALQKDAQDAEGLEDARWAAVEALRVLGSLVMEIASIGGSGAGTRSVVRYVAATGLAAAAPAAELRKLITPWVAPASVAFLGGDATDRTVLAAALEYVIEYVGGIAVDDTNPRTSMIAASLLRSSLDRPSLMKSLTNMERKAAEGSGHHRHVLDTVARFRRPVMTSGTAAGGAVAPAAYASPLLAECASTVATMIVPDVDEDEAFWRQAILGEAEASAVSGAQWLTRLTASLIEMVPNLREDLSWCLPLVAVLPYFAGDVLLPVVLTYMSLLVTPCVAVMGRFSSKAVDSAVPLTRSLQIQLHRLLEQCRSSWGVNAPSRSASPLSSQTVVAPPSTSNRRAKAATSAATVEVRVDESTGDLSVQEEAPPKPPLSGHTRTVLTALISSIDAARRVMNGVMVSAEANNPKRPALVAGLTGTLSTFVKDPMLVAEVAAILGAHDVAYVFLEVASHRCAASGGLLTLQPLSGGADELVRALLQGRTAATTIGTRMKRESAKLEDAEASRRRLTDVMWQVAPSVVSTHPCVVTALKSASAQNASGRDANDRLDALIASTDFVSATPGGSDARAAELTLAHCDGLLSTHNATGGSFNTSDTSSGHRHPDRSTPQYQATALTLRNLGGAVCQEALRQHYGDLSLAGSRAAEALSSYTAAAATVIRSTCDELRPMIPVIPHALKTSASSPIRDALRPWILRARAALLRTIATNHRVDQPKVALSEVVDAAHLIFDSANIGGLLQGHQLPAWVPGSLWPRSTLVAHSSATSPEGDEHRLLLLLSHSGGNPLWAAAFAAQVGYCLQTTERYAEAHRWLLAVSQKLKRASNQGEPFSVATSAVYAAMARNLWDAGHKDAAYLTLRGVKDRLMGPSGGSTASTPERSELSASVACTLGAWTSALQKVSASSLVHDVLPTIAEADASGEGHYLCATLADSLFCQIVDRVTSQRYRDYTKTIETTRQTHAELKKFSENNQQLTDADKRQLRLRVWTAERELNREDVERAKVADDFQRYRHQAMLGYLKYANVAAVAGMHAKHDGLRPCGVPDEGEKVMLSDEKVIHSVFRFVSLWLSETYGMASQLPEDLLSLLQSVPTRAFVPLAQLLTVMACIPAVAVAPTGAATPGTPSLATAGGAVRAVPSNAQLDRLVLRLGSDHPFSVVWHVMALANGDKFADGEGSAHAIDHGKVELAKGLLGRISRVTTAGAPLAAVVQQIESLSEAYLQLAFQSVEPGRHKSKTLKLYDAAKIVKLKPLTLVPIPTLNLSPHGYYTSALGYHGLEMMTSLCPTVHAFRPVFDLVGGINAPKLVYCVASDGREVKQLVKSRDDMRQDAMIERVFSLCNQRLMSDAETRRDGIQIRTYAVVPLSPTSGVLEWINGTTTMLTYLVGPDDGADDGVGARTSCHGRYAPTELKHNDCRSELEAASKSNATTKHNVYRSITERFLPLLHCFFFERFDSCKSWHRAKRQYLHSVATCCMLGYVVGLGDRHASNLLLDEDTAELIHIDLGLAFDQGTLLPIPEQVPFRLTRELVDGMGVWGVEGPFRAACEKVTKATRKNRALLLTMIEPFVHDPLAKWAVDPTALMGGNRPDAASPATGKVPPTPQLFGAAAAGVQQNGKGHRQKQHRADAERALARVKDKVAGLDGGEVLGVAGQVQKLIQQATSEELLSQMFCGWSPWL